MNPRRHDSLALRTHELPLKVQNPGAAQRRRAAILVRHATFYGAAGKVAKGTRNVQFMPRRAPKRLGAPECLASEGQGCRSGEGPRMHNNAHEDGSWSISYCYACSSCCGF